LRLENEDVRLLKCLFEDQKSAISNPFKTH
jgi:hypothetical protein